MIAMTQSIVKKAVLLPKLLSSELRVPAAIGKSHTQVQPKAN
jgi:hypothetical protein